MPETHPRPRRARRGTPPAVPGNGQAHDPGPWDEPYEPTGGTGPEAQGYAKSKGAGNGPEQGAPDSGKDSGEKYSPLPCRIFTFEDFETEPPPASFIIAGFTPQDVCMLNATGGTGKSTFELFRAIHIILGLPFFGMPIERPGPVLYITAEDGADRIHRRLYAIMKAMQLMATQRRIVADNFRVIDLCEYPLRLVTADRFGTLIRTSLAERIITDYRGFAPVVIDFDPFVRFSPGEEYGNDGGDQTIAAMLTISRTLSCATNGVHHISKAVYRDGTIDHHAGRGPSSIGDGARCVYSLIQVDKETPKLPGVSSVYQHYIDAGELMALFVTKLTDCKRPRDPFILRRNGWAFELLAKPTPESVEEAHLRQKQDAAQQNLAKLVTYLKARSFQKHGKTQLVQLHGEIGLARDAVEAAIARGIRDGILAESPPLPATGRGPGRRPVYILLKEDS